MPEHLWEKAYNKKTFFIETARPSILVEKHVPFLNKGDFVLDIGCGNGRNSVFLASMGCQVDCFDVADLNWYLNLSGDLKKNISFQKTSLENYIFNKNKKYSLVVVARVIQYLSPQEVISLIDSISSVLDKNGTLLLSYNFQGGIFNRNEIDVPKYSHPIIVIISLLEKNFKKVEVSEGARSSIHVNFQESMKSFDIVASRPKS